MDDIKKNLIKLQKKYSMNDFKLKKYIIKLLKKDKNDKHINHMVNDIYMLLNSIEKKHNDVYKKDIIKKHCKKLDLDFDTIYEKFNEMHEQKYFHIKKECFIEIKKQLEILVKKVNSKHLRNIIKECFYPKISLSYNQVRYILNNILKDTYIYTTQKKDNSCEHIVPKSIYNKQTPMVTDMHNIYLSPANINTLRDQLKFNNIETEPYKTIDETGKKNTRHQTHMNKYTDECFEPEKYSKGRIARSCAYFFSIYSEYIPFISKVIDIDVMIDWCTNFKPTKQEIKRSNFVYQIQKNINPFIVYPELINYIFDDIKCIDLNKIKYKHDLKIYSEIMKNNIPYIKEAYENYMKHVSKEEELINSGKISIQITKLNTSINKLIELLN